MSETSRTFSWENIAKASAAGVAVLYILGLIVVNFYLRAFGTTEYTLLRAQYIATGLLLAFPAIFAMCAPVIATMMYRHPFFQKICVRLTRITPFRIMVPFPPQLTRWINPVFYGVLPFAFFFYFVNPCASIWARLLISLGLYVAAAVVGWGVLGLGVVVLNRSELEEPDDLPSEARPPITVSLFVASLVVLVLTVGYIALFTRFVYPNVPPQFGGGQPLRVGLVLAPGSSHALSSLGLDCEPTGITKTMDLLYESDRFLVLRSPIGHVFRVDKGVVQAIDVQP